MTIMFRVAAHHSDRIASFDQKIEHVFRVHDSRISSVASNVTSSQLDTRSSQSRGGGIDATEFVVVCAVVIGIRDVRIQANAMAVVSSRIRRENVAKGVWMNVATPNAAAM